MKNDNRRNEKIIRDCKEKNIPYMVLKATDELTIHTIKKYIELAINVKCSPDFISDCLDKYVDFIIYQCIHQTKKPD